ncbi:MAG: hypothetical protein II820_05190 [Ruminiclostridium sp.]|nr:hypothetical protein [Ruminiclostridium sp.]
MKKRIVTASLLAAILAVSACGNNAQPATTTAAATSAAETTTAAAETTTKAEETTKAAEETAKTEATTAAADTASDGTVFFTDGFGNNYYREDGTINEDWGVIVLPYAAVRISTGLYIDSDSSPDDFEPEDFNYKGTKSEECETQFITAGDTVGSFKIKDVAASLRGPWNDETSSTDLDAEEGFTLAMLDINIDGDVTMTGYVRYYFDEQYGLSSGDIRFIPDSCYKGCPMPIGLSGEESSFGVIDFDEHAAGGDGNYYDTVYGGGVCIYSDAPMFNVGNLLNDYAGRDELYNLLDGGNADCSKKVEITLGDVHLGWNDNFGSFYSCTGVIKDMKVL